MEQKGLNYVFLAKKQKAKRQRLLTLLLAPPNAGYAATVEGMDGPTIVYVNTMIRSISKIDDYKMVSSLMWKMRRGNNC